MSLMYQPHGGINPISVRPSEVGIVGMVLVLWAFAVYIFINQWGKESFLARVVQKFVCFQILDFSCVEPTLWVASK